MKKPHPGFASGGPRASRATLEDGEVRVLRVDLAARESNDDDSSLLPEWGVLDEAERARAVRFVRPRDRRRFIICRGALRLVLGQLVGGPPAAITFRFGRGGKPELAGPRPPGNVPLLHFNVSHSDDLALIAVSLDGEVGVDVERLRMISEAARIVESYFTAAEQAQFAALDEPAQRVRISAGMDTQGSDSQGQRSRTRGAGDQFRDHVRDHQADGHVFTDCSAPARIGEWWLWEASPSVDYFAALAVQVAPGSWSELSCLTPLHFRILHCMTREGARRLDKSISMQSGWGSGQETRRRRALTEGNEKAAADDGTGRPGSDSRFHLRLHSGAGVFQYVDGRHALSRLSPAWLIAMAGATRVVASVTLRR